MAKYFTAFLVAALLVAPSVKDTASLANSPARKPKTVVADVPNGLTLFTTHFFSTAERLTPPLFLHRPDVNFDLNAKDIVIHRDFSAQFEAANTSYIYLEPVFHFVRPFDIRVSVEYRIVDPDDQQVSKSSQNIHYRGDWLCETRCGRGVGVIFEDSTEKAMVAAVRGDARFTTLVPVLGERTRGWKKGTYRVEIRVNDRLLGSERFSMN